MLALLVLGGALARPADPALVERRVSVMGTLLEVAVVADGREQGLAACEEAIQEVRRVEDLLTTWRDSPLSRLDAAEVGRRVPLDDELYGLLAGVFAWSARTGRAFDPTVLPLVRAWDLRGAGRVPSSEGLARALAATGVDRFRLDGASLTAARLDALAGIEEGAWGKGYALDRAAEKLELGGAAARGALLDLGGQVIGRGRDAEGRDWSIAVADPRRRDKSVVALRLSNASASTSGNSERGRLVGGRRIGHLLDPRTGEPAADFGSVTVVAPSALVADILSTALFVLGPERGLGLSEELRQQGIENEALFLVIREDGLEAVSSPGMSNFVLFCDPAAVRGMTPSIDRRR